MNWIVALGLGVVGGYAFCRAKEAKAQGVPLDRAFKEWNVSVMQLKMAMVLEENPQQLQLPGR